MDHCGEEVMTMLAAMTTPGMKIEDRMSGLNIANNPLCWVTEGRKGGITSRVPLAQGHSGAENRIGDSWVEFELWPESGAQH